MSVYAYCRATESVPLKAQQGRTADEAKRNGWTIDMTVIEDNPRRVPLDKRRQGKRLLRHLQPGDTIIAVRFNCVFVSLFEASAIIRDFRQRQISLWLLDPGSDICEHKTSETILKILSAVSKFKSEQSVLISASKARLRAEGKHQGGKRPFGWQISTDRTLIPDPVEQAAQVRMRELRAEGKSLREIAAALGDAGSAVSYSTVRRQILSPDR
jgi:DNA invertase Pin-like site-specific DNA recombinase